MSPAASELSDASCSGPVMAPSVSKTTPDPGPGQKMLKFQGNIPYTPPEKNDDWGFTPEQQEEKVERFRQSLEAKNAWRKEDHDYYTLLRFLRARNYEMDKAIKMWLDTLEWRKEYDVDNILDNFEFKERTEFLTCYPQGYHKRDKEGRPVYIQQLGVINLEGIKKITNEERMVKFHIQEYERCIKQILPVCSRLANRQIDQTFGIMDVRGVGLSHLTGEVRRLMGTLTKFDQDNYPEMLGRICIINAPIAFRAVWSIVKTMLQPRTVNKIQICGTNYMKDLLEWVEMDSIPSWLGGQSNGTLLDDVGPWSDREVLKKLSDEGLEAATKALRNLSKGQESEPDMEEVASGFQSPRSEASFYSITSYSVTSQEPPTAPLLRGLRRISGVDGEVLLVEGETNDSQDVNSINRSRALLDRINYLEQVFLRQLQRLKGYLPAEICTNLASRITPDGTLIRRVEILEEGMEALLKAQALSWQESEKKEKNRGCSACCTVM